MFKIGFKEHYRVLHVNNEIGNCLVGGAGTYMNEIYRYHKSDTGFVYMNLGSHLDDFNVSDYQEKGDIVIMHKDESYKLLSLDLAVSATTTPYSGVISTSGSSSSTTVSNTSSATTKTVTSSTTPSSSKTVNQTVSVATSSNTATLSSSTTYAYGNSASNSTSKMVSSTTLPYGTLERNGGTITILTSSSTTPSVTSSSATPQVSSSSTTLPAGTLERNGGYITIYSSSSTTPSATSSSTTPQVSSSSTTLPPGTIERNGGYITILTSSSTTPNISSGDTTISTGATTTPAAPELDVNKIDYYYSSIIEEIDNQIRALAYDSALKHEDPDGAKEKLAELQAMRQQIYQKMAMHNSISASVVEDIEYEAFSFTREEEKEFDLMVQENIMEFISQEEYSWIQWLKYTPEEKKELLIELAEYVCGQLGIPIPMIEYTEVLKPAGRFIYDDSDENNIKRTIQIPAANIGNGAANGVVETLIHELRHGYQWEVIMNPNLYVVSEETIAEWENNLNPETYVGSIQEDLYRAQAVEWDAVNFAKQTDNIKLVNTDLVTYEGSWEIE